MELEPASRYGYAQLAEIFNAGYEGYFTPFNLDEAAFRLMSTAFDEDLDASRVALVDGAQKTLDLQYYAIHADSSTEVLLEHTRAAARRGVRVRILLDDFNTVGADAQVLRLAFEPGIELRLFNPLPGSRGSLLTMKKWIDPFRTS